MTILITNWSVTPENDAYGAPECCTMHLQGNVHGHPRFYSGKFVRTSAIIGKKCGLVVTSSGSEYELGEPDPAYENQFPGARKRLLDSLPGE